jgi:hypothetical protein
MKKLWWTERERYAFYVEVVYKRLPDYCTHCQTIGHSVNGCNKLHPQFKSNPKSKLLKKGVSTKQQYMSHLVEKSRVSIEKPLNIDVQHSLTAKERPTIEKVVS